MFSVIKRTACSLLIATFVVAVGCQSKKGPDNTVRMADLHTQNQLLLGFYGLEAGAWRWTAKHFSVALKVPDGAAQKGGLLVLQGNMSADGLKNGPVQLSVNVGGMPLAPTTISNPGNVLYKADVPAAALISPTIVADYQLSNSFRVPGDQRDLGMVVSVVSLRAK